jgi:hypothetical protein
VTAEAVGGGAGSMGVEVRQMTDLARESRGSQGDKSLPVGGDSEAPAEEDPREMEKGDRGLNRRIFAIERRPGLGEARKLVN